MSSRAKWASFALLAALTFAGLEGFLRFQQRYLRWVDLEMSWSQPWQLSNTYNHLCYPPSGTNLNLPVFEISQDNQVRGQLMEVSPNKQLFTILFIGDSFMQGLSEKDQIPAYLAEYLKAHSKGDLRQKIRFVNAGCSSYAPSIFVPLTRHLLSQVSPNMVVVDIDETDFGDDTIRYKKLIQRNQAGQNIGVRITPLSRDNVNIAERVRACPLYLIKLALVVHHKLVEFPKLEKEYRRSDPRHVLSFAETGAKNPRESFPAESQTFEENLEEFFGLFNQRRLTTKLVLIRHPHRKELGAMSEKNLWKPVVPFFLQEFAARLKVPYFDAREELSAEFGNRVDDFYFPRDMHFNAAGLRAYANVIAKKILFSLEGALENSPQQAKPQKESRTLKVRN